MDHIERQYVTSESSDEDDDDVESRVFKTVDEFIRYTIRRKTINSDLARKAAESVHELVNIDLDTDSRTRLVYYPSLEDLGVLWLRSELEEERRQASLQIENAYKYVENERLKVREIFDILYDIESLFGGDETQDALTTARNIYDKIKNMEYVTTGVGRRHEEDLKLLKDECEQLKNKLLEERKINSSQTGKLMYALGVAERAATKRRRRLLRNASVQTDIQKHRNKGIQFSGMSCISKAVQTVGSFGGIQQKKLALLNLGVGDEATPTRRSTGLPQLKKGVSFSLHDDNYQLRKNIHMGEVLRETKNMYCLSDEFLQKRSLLLKDSMKLKKTSLAELKNSSSNHWKLSSTNLSLSEDISENRKSFIPPIEETIRKRFTLSSEDQNVKKKENNEKSRQKKIMFSNGINTKDIKKRTTNEICLRCERPLTAPPPCRFHPRSRCKLEQYDVARGKILKVVQVWECCLRESTASGCCTAVDHV
ncbi:DgyrCDS13971 [Dimorphilus gyrociliatus]|uniref:DgyrCDS13971 n=1 Tax=Dimorphilus gyrociliatus TaxID=2664684 RepID=A0A7I8WC54_9ANNE|nr:DgyrCDS13971 [Dimorphilus gyrociliatus]